jgi:hypothetical protein
MGLDEEAYHSHRKRPLPAKTVHHKTGPNGNTLKTGEDYELVKNGTESLAARIYRKRNPLGALVHRARGSMRDAMSPRESRSLHTRRRLLSIAICGQDRLLLLMVSIILLRVKRYVRMDC